MDTGLHKNMGHKKDIGCTGRNIYIRYVYAGQVIKSLSVLFLPYFFIYF